MADAKPARQTPKKASLSLAQMGDIHRALPHSLAAEEGTLGSMMISSDDVCGMVVEMGMKPEWFYSPAHGLVFGILIEFWEKQSPLDLIVLTQVLRDRKRLDEVGGPAFVSHLYGVTPTAANALYYAEIVRDKMVLRQLVAKGTEMASRAYDDAGEVAVLLDDSEAAVLSIRNDTTPSKPESTIKEHVIEAIENLELLYQNKGALTGLASGLKQIDRLTGGMKAPNMIVIAGRPSMGKTALCINIAEHVAVEEKQPVGIFSLEMSTQELVQRMLCSRARVSTERIRSGDLEETDFPNLTVVAGKISESPLYIDDTPNLPISELRAKARRWKRDYGIVLLVIDYLQLIRSTTKRAQENRQLEVAEISSGIKGLAKELSIPIIIAAQLNRNPEGRASNKPKLSDLRESGAIEQDSDIVGLLYRPEYYAETPEEKAEVAGLAELDIAKHRNGPVGTSYLTFLKEWTRFEDRARSDEQP